MKKNDITKVVDEKLCHSCGSCFTACGHESISFTTTVGGYLFPKINYDTCTNCGLCFDICPGDHFTENLVSKLEETIDPFMGTILSTYVGKATDEQIYKNSQSGGAVTAILKYLLDSEEVAAVVVVDLNMNIDHYSDAKIIFNSNELLKYQKSKYIPTNIMALGDEITKITGKIALVGLPCHIHGLENLLKIKRKLKNKIIKIGLICDRVMSSASIDFLTQEITNKHIKDFTFRDTSNSPYPGDISIKLENNDIKLLNKDYRMLMKDYFTPARCLLCFDKMNIYSDLVIGDPHGIKNIDRENGESLVLVRTDIGRKTIEKIIDRNEIVLRNVSELEAINGQSINAKKTKWYAHYQAWKELNFKLPEYPESVLKNVSDVSKKDIVQAKQNFKQAFLLDDYLTREELVADAKKYFRKIRLKQKLKFPIRIGNKIIKRLKNAY